MAYSTSNEIQHVISELGEQLTTDDSFSTTPAVDPTNTNAAIEKVDSIIDLNLRRLYSAASLSASKWVKWCSATLACCQLYKRRGNPCPQSLSDECQQYIDDLKAIAKGEMMLPDATYQGNHFPTVTNVTVNMRYPWAQIRRVPQTSTGNPPSPPAFWNNNPGVNPY
ncbi:MAG: hypothetical protein QM811_07020 [Pirellulales bacterium]